MEAMTIQYKIILKIFIDKLINLIYINIILNIYD